MVPAQGRMEEDNTPDDAHWPWPAFAGFRLTYQPLLLQVVMQ
jgi:hypothetical protein